MPWPRAQSCAPPLQRVSGVVPQIAVVTGVCGASSALAAAGADVCIMSEEGELFFTPPFTAAAAGDACPGAGKAAFAARAGVAALVVKNAEQAAAEAARAGACCPRTTCAARPCLTPPRPQRRWIWRSTPAPGPRQLCDEGSLLELWGGYGKNVYTALGTVGGSVVGVVATAGNEDGLCRTCVSKAARFVRLCDAFSIPLVTLCATAGFVPSATEDEGRRPARGRAPCGQLCRRHHRKVAVVTGNAVGPAWVALCNADLTIAVEGCTIAPRRRRPQ